jgi:hypothetical protein
VRRQTSRRARASERVQAVLVWQRDSLWARGPAPTRWRSRRGGREPDRENTVFTVPFF